jgi:hypothetical protein
MASSRRHVVAQRLAEAAGLDEVALHVDDDQRGVRRVEAEREGAVSSVIFMRRCLLGLRGAGAARDGRRPCARRARGARRRRPRSRSTMRPSLITTMRSASSSSSSRSSLISSTAAPRSRTPRMRAWISVTAAKSRPNTGLAAISTSMSPASSRASTARCTLPPDRLRDGRVLAARLDAVGRRSIRAPGCARAEAQHAAARQRRLVEVAQRHVLGHAEVADAGVAQRLLGQAAHLQAVVLGAAWRRIRLARHLHANRPARSAAGRPAPRPARAGRCRRRRRRRGSRPARTGEREAAHGQRAAVAHHLEALHFERGCTCIVPRWLLPARTAARRRRPRALSPTIACASRAGSVSATAPWCTCLAAAQHRDVVGIRHHLAELVRDQQHGAAAGALRSRARAQHLVGLLRRQHRGRLVQDQEARLQVQLLEQLQLLLLAGGQCPNGGHRGRAGTAWSPGSPRAARACSSSRSRRASAAGQQQVLGDRHARRQREVLVDHADAQRTRDDGLAMSCSRPSTRMLPSSARWKPAMHFTSVLLPAPFSPSSACTVPGVP